MPVIISVGFIISFMNYYVLIVFAPILIVVGIAGFLIPPKKSLTSGAPPYNIFHIAFGLIGLAVVYSQNDTWIRAFIIGFGGIDLYQAFASFLHLFPEKYFRWKRTDDILHLGVGLALVLIGIFGN